MKKITLLMGHILLTTLSVFAGNVQNIIDKNLYYLEFFIISSKEKMEIYL